MITARGLAVVSSLALSSSALAQNAVQWRAEDGGNGHWYAAVVLPSPGKNWTDARALLQSRGGDLASLETPAEINFATALVETSQYSGAWIGLYQAESSCEPGCGWTWVSGAALTDHNWQAGEPNNLGGGYGNEDRGLIAGTGWGCAPACLGKWVDWPGTTTLLAPVALGEWSADCNNDGVVDYGQIRSGSLADLNANDIPDCCEVGAPCSPIVVQWRAADGGNDHWYQFIRQQSNTCWTEAKNHSELLGGHLATVTSAPENEFLRNFVAKHNPGGLEGGPYIGGTCAGVEWGEWYWVTGEPFTFQGWNSGEPSSGGADRFLHFWRWSDLDWNDAPDCGNLMQSYIVEFDADCNGDGEIDFGQIRSGMLVDGNWNGVPDCCEGAGLCLPCRADVDQSGSVNGVDLAAILNNWGTSGGKQPRSDVNGDGIVDGADLAEVLNSWGSCI